MADPELVLSKPHETVAAAGIDAVSHALESHVTRKRSTGSAVLSAEAWQLLDANFPACFDEAADQLCDEFIGLHGRPPRGAA